MLINWLKKYSIRVFDDIPDDVSNIDFLVSIQYHRKLRKSQLQLAKKKAINLHMAPLPEYRDQINFTYAILNGEKEFGTTIHEMIPSNGLWGHNK